MDEETRCLFEKVALFIDVLLFNFYINNNLFTQFTLDKPHMRRVNYV